MPTPPASARSLLLTILGEHVLPHGGQVWTSQVIEAMELLGVEVGTARQALARAADAGLLTSTRVGRQARWELTERAQELLTEGTERIYALGRRAGAWDQRWLVVLASVPEADRPVRHRLRTQMRWAGLAPLASGTWISPWVERQPEAARLLTELGLAPDSIIFVARLGDLGEPRLIARRAWDLDGLDADYRRFRARFASVTPTSPGQAFVALTELVHDWRHFPAVDPDLPMEVLPVGWSGRDGATLFHRCHAAWSPEARAWWEARGAQLGVARVK